jgi:hypothetical protein
MILRPSPHSPFQELRSDPSSEIDNNFLHHEPGKRARPLQLIHPLQIYACRIVSQQPLLLHIVTPGIQHSSPTWAILAHATIHPGYNIHLCHAATEHCSAALHVPFPMDLSQAPIVLRTFTFLSTYSPQSNIPMCLISSYHINESTTLINTTYQAHHPHHDAHFLPFL